MKHHGLATALLIPRASSRAVDQIMQGHRQRRRAAPPLPTRTTALPYPRLHPGVAPHRDAHLVRNGRPGTPTTAIASTPAPQRIANTTLERSPAEAEPFSIRWTTHRAQSVPHARGSRRSRVNLFNCQENGTARSTVGVERMPFGSPLPLAGGSRVRHASSTPSVRRPPAPTTQQTPLGGESGGHVDLPGHPLDILEKRLPHGVGDPTADAARRRTCDSR